jgi:hypothetical protein
VQPKGTPNSLWYNAAEKKEKQAPPPFWSDTRGRPTAENRSDDFIVLHDEDSDANIAQDVVQRGAPMPDNRKKLGRMDDRREISVVLPAQQPRARAQAQRNGRYKINWRRLTLAAIAILIVSAGVGYGVFLVFRLIAGYGSQVIANSQDNSTKPALVEVAMINGEPWHRITFYGKDGDVVMLTDPKRTLTIKDGKAELMLEDQSYITADLTVDKVTVSLEGTLIEPNDKNTPIVIPPYVIDVPLAPLKIVLPSEQGSISTNADGIFVKIKVTPGSKRVMIGGNNVTDKISAEGYASHEVDLPSLGTNTITISVDTADYRKNVQTLKVERPILEVPIQLAANIDSQTSSASLLIKGSTNQGAKITTADGKTVNVSASGTFSFTAQLKAWGWNDIAINATSSDGRTSTIVHRVYHSWTEGSYSSKAQLLGVSADYNYLLSNTKLLIGRVYRLDGTVSKKLDNPDANYYLFDSGQTGNLMPVVLQYDGEAGLNPDQSYRVFCDVTGDTVQNLPVLYVRLDPQAPPTPSPGASSSPGATATPTAAN